MPAIPSWYATVKLKFTCENCRQKSSRPAPIPTLDVVAPRTPALVDDPAIEIAVDDADVDAAEDEDTDEVVDAVEVVDTEE